MSPPEPPVGDRKEDLEAAEYLNLAFLSVSVAVTPDSTADEEDSNLPVAASSVSTVETPKVGEEFESPQLDLHHH